MGRCLKDFFLLYFMLLMFPAVLAAQTADLAMTEEFLFQPLEKVITPGRTVQSIDRAPAAMTVITSQEIRASGAISIPELLRFVPGIDVVTISSSHSEVNARGLSVLPANKMLVMIDGRSVYYDYYGGVVWESLPVVMDQIDRIEIVRSPTSALYGANAFSGVINIITKLPGQMEGAQLRIQGGERTTLYSSLTYAASRENTNYSLALGTNRINSFDNPLQPSKKMFLSNFFIERRLGPQGRLSFEAGLSDGHVNKIFIRNLSRSQATASYLKFNASYKGLSMQAFWNRTDQNENTAALPEIQEDIFSNTFDLEIQNRSNLSPGNTLIYGASYRLNSIRSAIMNHRLEQDLYAGYFQDEFRPLPELTMLAGARIDRHPLVGTHVSPRGSIIISPSKKQVFRLSVSQAFRNPSFQNSDLDYKVSYGLQILGNRELEAEKITSFELGYICYPHEKAKLKFDAFLHKFRDNIFLEEAKIIGDYLVMSFTNQNRPKKIYGGETSAEYLPFSSIKIGANYSYQRLASDYFVGGQQSPPKHKASISFQASFPSSLSLNLKSSYTGGSRWLTTGPKGSYELKENSRYFRMDARLGYLPRSSGYEIFFQAYNLFGDGKREYPLAEHIKRRMTIGFYWSFKP